MTTKEVHFSIMMFNFVYVFQFIFDELGTDSSSSKGENGSFWKHNNIIKIFCVLIKYIRLYRVTILDGIAVKGPATVTRSGFVTVNTGFSEPQCN